MDKLLTVVVPAYNAEAYLRDNLSSLCIEGALEDTEVLVINDGSTDATHDIATEYAERFPDTVRVIDKENAGHGSGINRGIEEARGQYFKVVDADDWVEKEPYLKLLRATREQATDIVASGFYWAYDDGSGHKDSFRRKAEFKEPFRGVEYGRAYDFDDIAHKLYIKMHSMTIRTSILKGTLRQGRRIDEHCYYVDAEYILYPIPSVQTVSFIEDFVYMYRIGRQGQSVSPDKMRQNAENYDRVLATLLSFHEACQSGSIACSQQKLRYIDQVTARIVAGKIKILLSMPRSREAKSRLKSFDQGLRRDYPAIYDANQNRAVELLRKSRYGLYGVAAEMLKLKCGRTV